ncbi:MAG: hypothetical protein ACE5IC_00800 [Candidatus Brocadiales bacterium]
MRREPVNSIAIDFKEDAFSISLEELSLIRAKHLEAARRSALSDIPIATSVNKGLCKSPILSNCVKEGTDNAT